MGDILETTSILFTVYESQTQSNIRIHLELWVWPPVFTLLALFWSSPTPEGNICLFRYLMLHYVHQVFCVWVCVCENSCLLQLRTRLMRANQNITVVGHKIKALSDKMPAESSWREQKFYFSSPSVFSFHVLLCHVLTCGENLVLPQLSQRRW